MTTALIGSWFPGLVLSNASNGQILVDTGAMSALRGGYYLVSTSGSALAAVTYDLEIRNAANDATVKFQRRRFVKIDADSNARSEDFLMGNKIPLAQNQRLRCVAVGNIAAEVQMSILVQEIS